MNLPKNTACLFAIAVGWTIVQGWTSLAWAFPNWDDGCSNETCHGDFRESPYTSLSDGESWGNSLHEVHQDMVSNDCATCHSGEFKPVTLDESEGGAGLDPISCAGCHARVEPGKDDQVSGVGLRQHHFTASGGTIDCMPCHADANPANFTPIGEDVQPPYYADPGTDHPNIPDDPCNPSPGFPEDFAASALGLDNDGDGLYDEADVTDCPEPGGAALQLAALLALGATFRMRRTQRA